MAERIQLRAHAKLNLTLSVARAEPAGSTRAGWHRIASWFHAIELHDDVDLTIVPEGGRARIEWAADAPRPSPIDWPLSADLAVRARGLLERHVGRALPCDLVVRKRIPVGGGLGGGSSDAASTLMGLNRLFRLGLGTPQLRELSVPLGSDIAFFIDERAVPRPALVGDFGDRIERRTPLEAPVQLLFPPFGCQTRAVYQAFDALTPVDHRLREDDVRTIAARSEAARRVQTAELFNDLEPAADSVSGGSLAAIIRQVSVNSRVVMSGSGSTLFRIGEPGPSGDCASVLTRLA